MTPTNKGNYPFCHDCKFKIKDASSTKYPCYHSHNAVRGGVKYERDFKECLKYEKGAK
jgi:hypothetical protein